MKLRITLIILLGLTMSSCYFFDDIFDPPKEDPPSLQDKSEKAVSDYLIQTVQGKYKPYGFGRITIYKPVEIIELEKMQKELEAKPSYKLEKKIERQKKIIKRNNIERTLDLDHFFTVKDSVGNITIFETNFLLNDTLGVKDLSAKIMLKVGNEYEEVLDYFFYEYNIFLSHSYVESLELSKNFYAFFKEEMERKQTLQEKSAFLLHSLKMCKRVKDTGSFDQSATLEASVKTFMKKERTDIVDYDPQDFSTLYQRNDDSGEELIGYYFFHKFIGNYQDNKDTNVVLIEFTKHYEIENIYQMDRPFGQYFNQ